MNDHCAMYEALTIEEKLLIDLEMEKWYAESDDLCLPICLFKIVEIDFIERLKRKEENVKRNRKQCAGRANCKQSDTRNRF